MPIQNYREEENVYHGHQTISFLVHLVTLSVYYIPNDIKIHKPTLHYHGSFSIFLSGYRMNLVIWKATKVIVHASGQGLDRSLCTYALLCPAPP